MVNPEKLATLRQHDTRRRQTNKNNNTICVWHHYVQTNTENKTWALQQTTGGNEVKTIQILVTYAFGRRTLYIYFPCIREIWRFVHPRNMTISRGNKFAYLPYAKEWMFYSTRPTFFWMKSFGHLCLQNYHFGTSLELSLLTWNTIIWPKR